MMTAPTLVSITAIGSYFGINGILLAKWSRRLLGEVRHIGRHLGDLVPAPQAAGRDPGSRARSRVPPLIRNFLYHLVAVDGALHRTAESSVFISEAEILNARIHLKYLGAVPNQLLAIGIVGTFFALRSAIAGHFDDIPTMVKTVGEGLLSSLVGIAASLAFGILLSITTAASRASLHALAQTLDDRYPLLTLEEIQLSTRTELTLLHRQGLTAAINHALQTQTDTISKRLNESVSAFEQAWSHSVEQVHKQWVEDFSSSARSVRAAYRREVEEQYKTFADLVNRDLEQVGKRFAATLQSAVTKVRIESGRAIGEGFKAIRDDMERAFRVLTTQLTDTVSTAAERANTAATKATEASDAIANSFADVERRLGTLRLDVEASVGMIMTGFEQRVRLIIDQSAKDSILANSWHEKAVTRELAALEQWTASLQEQVNTMLREFADTLKCSAESAYQAHIELAKVAAAQSLHASDNNRGPKEDRG